MNSIEKLGLKELRSLLSDLKLYKDMTRKLGERGRKLFHSKQDGLSSYVVEYFSSLSEDEVYAQASEVYKKAFSATPSREEIQFVQVPSLGGGIRVYLDDEVIDMSFRKVDKLLRK